MTENIKSRSVNLALCDLARLDKYENKSEVIRKAIDIFIEREKRTEKDTIQKEINESIVSFGIGIDKIKYLESICINTEKHSRRYFSVSELVRVALRDFWEIEPSLLPEECSKDIKSDTRNYIEKNGIKIIGIA